MSDISMFKDEVYDNLDDISKLVEPIESTINNELSKFPDKVEITIEDIRQLYSYNWGWSSLQLNSIVSIHAQKLGLLNLFRLNELQLSKFFKFEVEDIEDGDEVKINLTQNTMSHKVYLVKYTIGYDDRELEDMVKSSLTRFIKGNLHSARTVNKPRLNELADLFGAKDVKGDRSFRGKVNKFCKHMDSLVDDKKLNIRDLDLCGKFSVWIGLYVRDGNLAALNNITRIKIMMHENRPIYSIQEKDTK